MSQVTPERIIIPRQSDLSLLMVHNMRIYTVGKHQFLCVLVSDSAVYTVQTNVGDIVPAAGPASCKHQSDVLQLQRVAHMCCSSARRVLPRVRLLQLSLISVSDGGCRVCCVLGGLQAGVAAETTGWVTYRNNAALRPWTGATCVSGRRS